MKTIIYTNDFNKGNKIKDLIYGLLMSTISFSGLFMESKLILKLIMYIIPIIILLYSIKLYKIAFYFSKKNLKKLIISFLQSITLTSVAIYIIFFPIESLNYVIITIGVLFIINSLNNIILYNTKLSFPSFFFGILCILFSNVIINTFYTFMLIIILAIGISKVTTYFYK